MLNTRSLRAIAQAATPGPWRAASHNREAIQEMGADDDWTVLDEAGKPICMEGSGHDNTAANAQFIQTFNPTVVQQMLDEIDTWRKATAMAMTIFTDKNTSESS